MEFTYFFLVFLLSYIFSNLGNWLTIQLAKRHQLVEATDYRKLHIEKVAALGGIPIFTTLLVFSFSLISYNGSFFSILMATSLLFGIGLWDDLRNIGVKRRLFIQFMVANMAFFAGFHFNIDTTIFQNLINYGLTIGFIGLMINGTNFIDGINGLAGSIGLVAMLVFTLIFANYSAMSFAFLGAAYTGTLLGFLRYNFGKRAAIFMGDNGSTVLGFILAIFFLKAYSLINTAAIDLNLLPISLILIALPILDLLGVVIIRICKGKSPFKADRIHLHHLLTDSGMSHPKTCQLILGWLVSLLVVIYLGILSSIPIVLSILTGSYLAIRFFYTTTIKPPLIFSAKWDKPVPQQL